jgi:uracil phosphoribosyltransferase
MAKAKVPVDEKFQNQELDLFEILTAIDKKDYAYFEKLTEEQQRKFVPYMLTHWVSAVKGASDIQGYYVMATDSAVNKHLFNEHVQRHPKLHWLMFCAAGLGMKQFHQWIPHIKVGVTSLRDPAKVADIIEYFTKIYPKTDGNKIIEMAESFVTEQKKMHYLAKIYPNLKREDIKLLAHLVTDEDIIQYEKDQGN